MWSNICKTISFIAMMHWLLWSVPIASGQYTVPWFTIDSGGGYSASGDF